MNRREMEFEDMPMDILEARLTELDMKLMEAGESMSKQDAFHFFQEKEAILKVLAQKKGMPIKPERTPFTDDALGNVLKHDQTNR